VNRFDTLFQFQLSTQALQQLVISLIQSSTPDPLEQLPETVIFLTVIAVKIVLLLAGKQLLPDL